MSIEVAIVGGGQAGLATSYHLRQAGVEHVVLEAGPSIGGSWSRRWDTLTLFTPAGFSNLPGLPFPADSDSYPGKDDVAQYLQRYASAFDQPVRTNQQVTLLRHAGGRFRIETGTGDWTARWVIIATGAFGAPWKPGLAAGLGEVRQLHADQYRRPSDIPPGRVVIVGAGNTGSQLAWNSLERVAR